MLVALVPSWKVLQRLPVAFGGVKFTVMVMVMVMVMLMIDFVLNNNNVVTKFQSSWSPCPNEGEAKSR